VHGKIFGDVICDEKLQESYLLLGHCMTYNSSSPTSPKSSLHTQGEHSLPAEMFLNSNQAGQLLVFVIVWPPSYST